MKDTRTKDISDARILSDTIIWILPTATLVTSDQDDFA